MIAGFPAAESEVCTQLASVLPLDLGSEIGSIRGISQDEFQRWTIEASVAQ